MSLYDMHICLLVISLKITSIKKSNNSWAILKKIRFWNQSLQDQVVITLLSDCITCTENLILLTLCSNLFCESILRSEYII